MATMQQNWQTRQGQQEEETSYAAGLVQEYPWSSVMLALGAGVAVGVILGQTVCDTILRHIEAPPSNSEKLMCHIRDAVKNALPESVLRHFES